MVTPFVVGVQRDSAAACVAACGCADSAVAPLETGVPGLTNKGEPKSVTEMQNACYKTYVMLARDAAAYPLQCTTCDCST